MSNATLARLVALEWESQKELIMASQMHLTGLANVSLDNPTGASKEDLIDTIMGFLETDTVLFFSGEVRERKHLVM